MKIEELNQEPTLKTIVRCGLPNKYDHCEQGTVCKVFEPDGSYHLYKQHNKDETDPIWILM